MAAILLFFGPLTRPLFRATVKRMRLVGLAVFFFSLLETSCGPSQPTYTDRVQDVAPDGVDPRLAELTKLAAGKSFNEFTSLVVVWKDWLDSTETPIPLVEGNRLTFVYYDATDSLDQVWLAASFCPAPLPLLRWEATRLFFRTFVIPKPAGVKYQFVASPAHPKASILSDVFHPDVTSGVAPLSCFPSSTSPRIHSIDASLIPALASQNLRILLPPDYDRDLSHSWPLMVLTGQSDLVWDQVPTAAIANGTVIPLVIVALVPDSSHPLTAQSLPIHWNRDVLPWLSSHYRVVTSAGSVFWLAWGDTGPAVSEAAAAHPDLFGNVWTPPAGMKTEDPAVWNQSMAQVLRTSFPKVAP